MTSICENSEGYHNVVNNVGTAAAADIKIWEGMKKMYNQYNSEQDRVFSLDEFKQFDRLNQNTNSRIPIFFCIDVSGSMGKNLF